MPRTYGDIAAQEEREIRVIMESIGVGIGIASAFLSCIAVYFMRPHTNFFLLVVDGVCSLMSFTLMFSIVYFLVRFLLFWVCKGFHILYQNHCKSTGVESPIPEPSTKE